MTSLDSRLRSFLTPTEYVWLARIPFIVAAVGGAAILVSLKLFGAAQIWVTSIAILLMLIYALGVSLIPNLRLREDLLGDNCYYLGFLYTLFSLAWALYEFGANGDTSLIIENFGIALGTTIVGILLRVTINQSRKDVLETEADARMELAHAVIRMRSKIDDAVLALDSFVRITQQTLQEQINQATDLATGAMSDTVEKVGGTTTRVLDRIDEAFEEFRAHAAQMNEASAGTVKGLQGLMKKIEKIDAPSDLVSGRLEPVMTMAEEAVSRMEGLLKREEDIRSSAAERSLAATRQIEQAVEKISAATEALARTANLMEGVTQSASAAAEGTAKSLDKTGEIIEAQLRSAEQVRSAMGNLIEDIAGEQKKAAKALGASLEEVIKVLQAHNRDLANEVERSRRMAADTGSALSQLADSIVERIG